MGEPIRQAVVLAGGKGSRLGALTAELPKPLLPVGGRPFLDWVIANLQRQGIDEVILTIGYRAEAFDRWLGDYQGSVSVGTFVEERPLDTGGALPLLGSRLHDTFFVLNGDTLFDVPLADLSALMETPETDAALALRRVDNVARYGRVEVRNGEVTAFAEKDCEGPGWINGGVYALRRSSLVGRHAPMSIERTFLPELVSDGRVTALPCDGFFIDIGLPESLRQAQLSVPAWWSAYGGGASNSGA